MAGWKEHHWMTRVVHQRGQRLTVIRVNTQHLHGRIQRPTRVFAEHHASRRAHFAAIHVYGYTTGAVGNAAGFQIALRHFH